MIVVEGVPEKIGFQFFSTYSTLVTNFIPRSIYPDKKGLSEAVICPLVWK